MPGTYGQITRHFTFSQVDQERPRRDGMDPYERQADKAH